jgi:hypothetical protein
MYGETQAPEVKEYIGKATPYIELCTAVYPVWCDTNARKNLQVRLLASTIRLVLKNTCHIRKKNKNNKCSENKSLS